MNVNDYRGPNFKVPLAYITTARVGPPNTPQAIEMQGVSRIPQTPSVPDLPVLRERYRPDLKFAAPQLVSCSGLWLTRWLAACDTLDLWGDRTASGH